MLAQKLYIDLVLLSRRINRQLDFQELPFGDQLEPFPAEFDRFDMIGQSLVVQIASQEHIDVPRRLVGIEKGKNERVFFVDNVIKDSLVQKAAGIDGNPGFKPEALHHREESAEIVRIRGHGQVDIHRDPLHAVEHAGHASTDDEIHVCLDQGG